MEPTAINRIVFEYNRCGVIYFPIGKKATCEFASKKCLANCSEKGVNETVYKQIYKYVIGHKPSIVAAKIKNDMDSLNLKLLTWFAAGDCTAKDQSHILEVVASLSNTDIVQHGFTRNEEFWKIAQGIKNCKFILTVESIKEKNRLINFGTIAIPNYKIDEIDIYKMKKHNEKTYKKVTERSRMSCGSSFTYNKLVGNVVSYREAICTICYDKKEGCFK